VLHDDRVADAISRSASRRTKVCSVRYFESLRTRVDPSSFGRFSRVNLPVSTPPRSGLHGVTPNPHLRAIGIRSYSTVRCRSEYSIWIATGCVHPRKTASYIACTHTHAGWSLKPEYRILPCCTRMSSVCIVSSIGVWTSWKWHHRRSM
jgi:hypothetical protein